MHAPLFVKKRHNRLWRCALSTCIGYPVSVYVPVHNLSHHLGLQTPRDMLRTTDVSAPVSQARYDARIVLISVLVELHVVCPGCLTALPPNGVCGEVACYCCGKVVALPATFWRDRFDKDDFEPWLLEEGRDETSAVRGTAGVESRLRYARERPACGGCRAPFDDAELVAALAGGALPCRACARVTKVRAADDAVRTLDRRAVMVIDETIRVVEHVRQPIVFACMKCGGPLSVDGRSRTIDCSYCSAPNYLPDGVWQAIYPTPALHPFYLACEYDEDALRDARWRSSEHRAKDAARTDLTPALYGRLARDDDDDVRVAVAHNPGTPPELVARLLEDDDADVRRAAVAHPQAPSDALAALARKEYDDGVVEALIARPALPPLVVDALAASTESKSRVHAIQHPNLPHATLRKLADDDREERIKKLAKDKIAELRAKGIHVPGGGFFARLFGG